MDEKQKEDFLEEARKKLESGETTEKDLRDMLRLRGHDPDTCPKNDHEFAQLGFEIYKEWKNAGMPPTDMQIPIISLCGMFFQLMDSKGHKPTDAEMLCLHDLMATVWQMAYIMGQTGWRDPYNNPLNSGEVTSHDPEEN